MNKCLKVIPLGGIDEIGKNITAVEYEDDLLIIDCGMAFPDEDMLGIDLVIPDFSYIESNIEKLRGIVITHGHEDHIGAIPYFLKQFNAPIYGTELTIALIESKLSEQNMAGADLRVVKSRDIIDVGCFQVEFIKVSHSIQGAVGLAIRTPAGVLVHTGDFKIDYTPVDGEIIDLARFASLGEEGVLLLMADSTNAEHPGYTISESKVGENLDEIIKEASGRIIVSTFSTNIHRIQQIIDASENYGRKVCLSGRSMIRVSNVASDINELKSSLGTLIDISETKNYPGNRLTIITTGSQGEAMSGLVRMATGSHSQIDIGQDDTVIISASPIPGNEKLVYKVINQLFKRGANVIYGAFEDVHTSGHACQEELKIMHSLVKPRYFMPVHGEYRHLKLHGRLAESLGMERENIVIPELGRTYEFTEDSMELGKKIAAGAVLVDGLGIGDVGNVVLRDRKHLSQDGLIIVVVTISAQDGSILAGPDIISRGFIYVRESDDLIEELKDLIADLFESAPHGELLQWSPIKAKMRTTIRKYLFNKTGRKPMVLPIFMEI